MNSLLSSPQKVSYITSIERIGFKRGFEQGRKVGRQEGAEEGLLAGIELGLELRFGAPGLRLLPEIRKTADLDVLHALLEGLKTVDTLEDLQIIYQ